MPKEVIHDNYGAAVAQVSWSPDQDLQLATLSKNPNEFIAWCRDLVERADREAVEIAQAQLPPGAVPKVAQRAAAFSVADESLGIFWTPDRQEVNQLIRVLRRARNSAYGADE